MSLSGGATHFNTSRGGGQGLEKHKEAKNQCQMSAQGMVFDGKAVSSALHLTQDPHHIN